MTRQNNRQKNSGMPEVAKYLISAVILGLAAFGTYGLTLLKENPKKKDSNALIPLVQTTPVQSYSGSLDMVVSGTVVRYREIKVAAEVGGKVTKKYLDLQAGNFVTKGTKLLEIDTEEYQLDINTSQREYEQTQLSMGEMDEDIRGAIKNVKSAQSDLVLQKREYQRIYDLRSALAASEVDAAKRALLNSQTNLSNRRNALAKLKASKERMKSTLEVAQSRLNRANLNLSRTTITAPDDGIIVSDGVAEGDNVFRNSQLFTLEDTSRSEVRCNLTPGELNWLRSNSSTDSGDDNARQLYRLPKTEVKIFETSDPNFVWTGVLERFDGIGRDELTKSIPVRIVVSNPIAKHGGRSKALVRGMYVKCRVVVPLEKIAATGQNDQQRYGWFPEVAVRPGNYVWAVRDKKLNRFDISIVDRTQIDVEGDETDIAVITLPPDGLKIGDAIVTSPIPQPTEGSPVILPDDPESESIDSEDESKIDATVEAETDETGDQS